MKHEEHLTDKDRADLARAAYLVNEGKVLRRQVFARLRARDYRTKHAGTKCGQETGQETAPATRQK